ncbi:MAG: hypothetical protein E7478_08665 [Ruminococcaceae bacterium]|nr:hypothetical protein [Oscillospiraceae bacterium]
MNENILITILAQDRKRIVLLKNGKVEVTRNLGGGKDGKYAIVAGNEIILDTIGTYPEEKDAIDALEKLFAAIAAGEKTYIMN